MTDCKVNLLLRRRFFCSTFDSLNTRPQKSNSAQAIQPCVFNASLAMPVKRGVLLVCRPPWLTELFSDAFMFIIWQHIGHLYIGAVYSLRNRIGGPHHGMWTIDDGLGGQVWSCLGFFKPNCISSLALPLSAHVRYSLFPLFEKFQYQIITSLWFVLC